MPRWTILLVAACTLAGCEDESHERGATRAALQEVGAAQVTSTSWRKCEIEGPLACQGAGEVCDMLRNECVPVCEGEHCCSGVVCPPGSECVPGTGRCGIPVGQGCFDMGSAWWTGRDIPPGQRRVPEEPTPAIFVVHNAGDEPLYFRSTPKQPARFAILQQTGGKARKLDLAVNHYCPTLCPEQGPAMELDCGREPLIVQRLLPGESMSLRWSGQEQVGTRRICGRPPGQFCYVARTTMPGTYRVQICAQPELTGGRPDPEHPGRLLGAKLSGKPECVQVEFRHPVVVPVDLLFGE